MGVRACHNAHRSSREAAMLKFLIAFITIVFIAGYTVQPPEKTMSYKVTLRNGDSVWDACARVASDKDHMQELVYNALKENRINDPGNVQPGTEIVIRVKEMK